MTKQLPPEDQPPGQGLIPGPESEAIAAMNQNPPGGPWAVGWAFWTALIDADGPQLDVLRYLVTPESLAGWGDFGAARERAAGTGVMSRAEIPAPGVAYVRFPYDPDQSLQADSDVSMKARAVATLQFRLEAERWQVHAFGDYVLPEDLPVLPAES